MIKRKKVVSLVLALALFAGLFGCAGQAQSNEVESAVSEGSSMISSESTSSVEYVPLDRFEDANIINIVYTRKYLKENEMIINHDAAYASNEWSLMFIKDNYKNYSPYNISCEYKALESYSPYDYNNCDAEFTLFVYYIEFHTKTALKELSPDESGGYSFYLQVVMKKIDFYKQSLLGFVTSQTRQIDNARDLAEFLKKISGYECLELKRPVIPETLPENIEIIYSADFTNLHITDKFIVKDTIYFFGMEPCYWLTGKTDLILQTFSLPDFRFLYEYHFSFYDDRINSMDDEGIIIKRKNEQGNIYFHATETGVSQLPPTPDSEKDLYRLSETAAIRENDDGDLLLEQNGKTVILFDGTPYTENASSDICTYYFYYRVNDSAFIYMSYGYEWWINCGIYDIATRTNTVFSHENAADIWPIAVGNNKVILAADAYEWYTSYGPYVYDAVTGEISDLNWFSKKFEEDYEPVIDLFGDKLIAFSEENSEYVIRVCDLSTDTKPTVYRFSRERVGLPLGIYQTEDSLWFFIRSCIFRMKSER
ncbi:MAG TPA: hypothetical protein PK629_04725 [Oscillospiraceae bacterium]|nr:hypothetical protein [Oscillospiraceae bacterium]HPF55842.1 hypothetical protein [Clostridiales bacterium]HPK34850.1 hypothetical protein [Oscillospiraceae bacterium]HPR76186.1 hypothetical protein [Oscillospiraceae bacterium]